MGISSFDHYTVRSADTDASWRFYEQVLGLTVRPREGSPVPAFIVSIGEVQVVHVFRASEEMEKVFARQAPTDEETALWRTGRLHHVEFWATGLSEVRERLRAQGVAFSERTLADKHQVGLRDPDGIIINLNFALTELNA